MDGRDEPRDVVFRAINEETAYQKQLWDPTASEGDHSVTEFLVFMRDYIEEGLHIESRVGQAEADEKALHIVRKVAGMAVACMEQNGVRPRRPIHLTPGELVERRRGDHTTKE